MWLRIEAFVICFLHHIRFFFIMLEQICMVDLALFWNMREFFLQFYIFAWKRQILPQPNIYFCLNENEQGPYSH
jgi:hypothetical protein